MANVKISELPVASQLTQNDLLPSVSGSTTSQISLKNLANSLPQVTSSISASYVPSMITTGSLSTSQSINGYVVLSQVADSLNFEDDAAAAAGGVPLGGLYRNGNFVVIRIS